METEELIKLVDGIYKNILDKFNPGARQMINAGKAYLKALHGAAAASRLYVDAISKLAKQAQQGTWGGSSDIGAALMKIVEVYKEIQDQQMNILKAFYVDLLVPLETNLEKDTKVVQSEQKRFLQQHKQRAETYSKAAAIMKKQRKKSRSSSKTGLAMDKELKNMQVLEEEKSKLDAFCEQSLKNAMTQERRRYGFVLERQCSLAKHHLSYHTQGVTAYQQNLEKWSEVAKSREYLPDSVENIFSNRLRQISVWHDEDVYSNPRSPNFEEDRISITSQLRKTKSMDASCLDIRSIGNAVSPINTLSRAKSEYNLHSSTNSLAQEHTPTRRPKSMAVPPPPQWDTQLARALYAYLSSGENQLSFLEGDLIALIGERNKGWQFGENLRTQCSGWFPLAYTEILDEANVMSPAHGARDQHSSGLNSLTANSSSHTNFDASSGSNSLDSQTPRMFGDTLTLHRSSNNAKQIRRAIGSNNIPPPALPAPVPTPTLPYKTGITQSQSTNFTKSAMDPSYHHAMKSSASTFNFTTPANGAYTNHPQPSPPSGPYSTHPQPSRSDRPPTASSLPPHLQTKGHQAAMPGKIGGPVGNVSLHSSNDSGFSNDPPPQPEIDYSDDESITGQTKLPNRISNKEIGRDNNNNPLMKPIRHSRSHGNIVDNKYHMSSDPETLAREHKAYVKRTKSFWKFGKNNSDNEILEGMALWRHRDLVDINDNMLKTNKITNAAKKGKVIVRREKSNDSDRTINNNYAASEVEERKIDKKKRSGVSQKKISVVEKQQISLPVRKESELQDENVDYHKKSKSNKYDKNSNKFDTKSSHYDREFYDDDGDDGLMLRTVNRKNILQQYNDSTCGETSSEESDPYDCIVVDDQKVNKKSNNFPNVAEIGKKLEKLSKSSKYPPGKDNNNIDNGNQIRNSVADKNNKNIKYNNATGGEKNAPKEEEEIIHYDKQRNTFKTFGHNNAKDDKKTANYEDEEKYYATKRNNEPNVVEKRRFYASESKERTRAPRPSYESMDSSIDPHMRDSKTKSNNTRRMDSSSGDKRERTTNQDKTNNNYYDSTNDELSDVVESRQFLPRTKLSKTNSNNSKYTDNDVGLMEYGATLQRRLKDPEFRSSFEDRHNGNMYGPWYDLWGMEATAQKS